MEDREEDESVMEDNNHQAEGGEEIPFQILVGGSLRGRCKLKDSKGYTYTVKREKGEKTWWVCSVRSLTHRCSAAVTQCGNTFTLGKYPHDHPPFMKRFSLQGIKKHIEDNVSKFTMTMIDDGDDLSNVSNEENDVQSFNSSLNSPLKKQRLESTSPSNVQQELLKIEQERLKIEKQRLAVEKQRLVIEKQKLEKANKRLEIEIERLEETKKHTSQCLCMNRTEGIPFT